MGLRVPLDSDQPQVPAWVCDTSHRAPGRSRAALPPSPTRSWPVCGLAALASVTGVALAFKLVASESDSDSGVRPRSRSFGIGLGFWRRRPSRRDSPAESVPQASSWIFTVAALAASCWPGFRPVCLSIVHKDSDDGLHLPREGGTHVCPWGMVERRVFGTRRGVILRGTRSSRVRNEEGCGRRCV